MEVSEKTILYLILFVIPGFVASKVYRSIVSTHKEDEKISILSAISTSSVLYSVALPIFHYKFGLQSLSFWYGERNWSRGMWLLGVWFSAPIVGGWLAGCISQNRRWKKVRKVLRLRAPEPTAWDTIFSSGECWYVIAVCDDGKRIAGLYDATGVASEAGSQDIYLSAQLTLSDDGQTFLDWVPNTRGCWIPISKIRYLEFFEYTPPPAATRRRWPWRWFKRGGERVQEQSTAAPPRRVGAEKPQPEGKQARETRPEESSTSPGTNTNSDHAADDTHQRGEDSMSERRDYVPGVERPGDPDLKKSYSGNENARPVKPDLSNLQLPNNSSATTPRPASPPKEGGK